MNDVDGLILAAGRSSLMVSGNKVQAPLGDKTLLQQVIDRLVPQVGSLFINGDPLICAEACGNKPYPFIKIGSRPFRGRWQACTALLPVTSLLVLHI